MFSHIIKGTTTQNWHFVHIYYTWTRCFIRPDQSCYQRSTSSTSVLNVFLSERGTTTPPMTFGTPGYTCTKCYRTIWKTNHPQTYSLYTMYKMLELVWYKGPPSNTLYTPCTNCWNLYIQADHPKHSISLSVLNVSVCTCKRPTTTKLIRFVHCVLGVQMFLRWETTQNIHIVHGVESVNSNFEK